MCCDFFVAACLRIVRAVLSGCGIMSGSSQQPVVRPPSSSNSDSKASSQLSHSGSLQSHGTSSRCNGTSHDHRNIKVKHGGLPVYSISTTDLNLPGKQFSDSIYYFIYIFLLYVLLCMDQSIWNKRFDIHR